eukprot:TRINITY_DN63244_c0_g1_i1.p1 TRINITY_DN63244_c0_g1~~TRINITY_DN63244_c0_g1_i1.p1  ORF type:complete len:744 (-),score=228.53 TRINITY_DN63244_c0_g1_i1:349-2415(-)
MAQNRDTQCKALAKLRLKEVAEVRQKLQTQHRQELGRAADELSEVRAEFLRSEQNHAEELKAVRETMQQYLALQQQNSEAALFRSELHSQHAAELGNLNGELRQAKAALRKLEQKQTEEIKTVREKLQKQHTAELGKATQELSQANAELQKLSQQTHELKAAQDQEQKKKPSKAIEVLSPEELAECKFGFETVQAAQRQQDIECKGTKALELRLVKSELYKTVASKLQEPEWTTNCSAVGVVDTKDGHALPDKANQINAEEVDKARQALTTALEEIDLTKAEVRKLEQQRAEEVTAVRTQLQRQHTEQLEQTTRELDQAKAALQKLEQQPMQQLEKAVEELSQTKAELEKLEQRRAEEVRSVQAKLQKQHTAELGKANDELSQAKAELQKLELKQSEEVTAVEKKFQKQHTHHLETASNELSQAKAELQKLLEQKQAAEAEAEGGFADLKAKLESAEAEAEVLRNHLADHLGQLDAAMAKHQEAKSELSQAVEKNHILSIKFERAGRKTWELEEELREGRSELEIARRQCQEIEESKTQDNKKKAKELSEKCAEQVQYAQDQFTKALQIQIQENLKAQGDERRFLQQDAQANARREQERLIKQHAEQLTKAEVDISTWRERYQEVDAKRLDLATKARYLEFQVERLRAENRGWCSCFGSRRSQTQPQFSNVFSAGADAPPQVSMNASG